MSKQKVTISLDSKTYSEFRDYCQQNAIMLSRKIEIWIEEFLKDTKENLKEVKQKKSDEKKN